MSINAPAPFLFRWVTFRYGHETVKNGPLSRAIKAFRPKYANIFVMEALEADEPIPVRANEKNVHVHYGCQ